MGWRTDMARSRIVDLANFQQFTAINLLSDPGAIGGFKRIPSCANIQLRFNLPDGKIARCILNGRYTSNSIITAGTAQAIFSALSTGAAWAQIVNKLSANTQFAGVDLRDMDTPGNPLISSTGAAIVGTGTGTLIPDEMAICVTLRTAKTGPQNRGRFYLTGWDSVQVGPGNTIAAGTVTAINTWVAGFTSIFAGQGLTWVVGQPARAQYTGSTGTVHPARTATSINVTSALVRDNHWDSQRRRGLK